MFRTGEQCNETLEWEFKSDMTPPRGSPVTIIIEPSDEKPATRKRAEEQFNPVGAGRGIRRLFIDTLSDYDNIISDHYFRGQLGKICFFRPANWSDAGFSDQCD